jgi:2-dehydropantoate 2-reductase
LIFMKIVIVGAGAVGCYYGGLLARAGNEVILIGRSVHVEAIRENGLLLETANSSVRIPLQADTHPCAAEGAWLVLCCVKSSDTALAAESIATFAHPDTLVLSLQNGVENADLLASRLPCAVEPVSVYMAAEMAAPGHVRHHGGGGLVIGETSNVRCLAELFAAASIPVRITGDMPAELWKKLTINCAYNALSAITALPYGPLVQIPGIVETLHGVVDECVEVARKLGITLPGDLRKSLMAIAESMPAQISSTAQDLRRNRTSEIDHLNGYVVRKGIELGVATPLNRLLHALVKGLETGYAKA